MTHLTICAYCEKEFEQTRRDQKFCSPNCRKYAYNERQRQKAENNFPVDDLPIGEPFIFLPEITRQQIRSQFFSIKPAEITHRRWQQIKSGNSTYLSLPELDSLKASYSWFAVAFKRGEPAPNSRTEPYVKRIVSSRA